MAIVCPNQGEINLLQYIVGMVAAGNPVLHLFSNNITPGESTVINDLTQVSAAGYAPVTLLSTGWTTTNSSGVSSAVYSEETFVFSTNAVAFGYYVTDETNKLLWLERFPGNDGFQIPDGGGTISITAKLQLN